MSAVRGKADMHSHTDQILTIWDGQTPEATLANRARERARPVFFPHTRADDVIYPRPALKRDVPKSPFTATGSASAHRRASHFKIPAIFFPRRRSASGGGGSFCWSYLPRR